MSDPTDNPQDPATPAESPVQRALRLKKAAIDALKSGQLGGLAIDVYEQEADLFFRDLSSEIITDDVFQRLIGFPNVIVTGHQAFFTREAISTISETTIESISDFAAGKPLSNEIRAQPS